jgi:hypothetical protein
MPMQEFPAEVHFSTPRQQLARLPTILVLLGHLVGAVTGIVAGYLLLQLFAPEQAQILRQLF